MNILETIVEHKLEEVAARKGKIKISALSEFEFFDRSTTSLRESLHSQKIFGIIAEVKRSSPSGGSLRTDIVPEHIASEYETHGAAGISVLTDERFFSGTLDDLCRVRKQVSLPLLRKDFIVHEYQLHEAKAYGADAVLLIAGILEHSQLKDLHTAAKELGLEALVELYETPEIDILDFDSMKFIGINNRNLRTFKVDLNRTFEISKHIPKDVTLVSESGIHSSEDLKRLKASGIHSALIGEHFMKSENPGKALTKMLDDLQNETSR
jgi:indole-3-glycerol phosphate synthase